MNYRNWILLTKLIKLKEIKKFPAQNHKQILKQSTRCSISNVAMNRLERAAMPDGVDFYFLDLIAYKNISNKIAEDFAVYHESPQILLIKNGECIFDESHSAISMDEITEQL